MPSPLELKILLKTKVRATYRSLRALLLGEAERAGELVLDRDLAACWSRGRPPVWAGPKRSDHRLQAVS